MNRKKTSEQRLAIGLGVFSIGLGLAQIFSPRRVADAAGMKRDGALMRAFGAREILTGVGVLSQRKTARWLWGRVAGDAIDLVVLGAAIASARSKRRRNAVIATAAVAGVTALDIFCSKRMSARKDGGTKTLRVGKTVTIDRSPEELYAYWRQFEKLGEIMNHLVSVQRTSENRWHWIAKAPAGRTVEWDAEIIEEVPNRLIAWHSLPGADVDNWGEVRFEPAAGKRGTVVHVELEYSPPAGMIGAGVAKLFGEAPELQISADLRRFKQLMETGEMARTAGQSAGRSKSTSVHDRLVNA